MAEDDSTEIFAASLRAKFDGRSRAIAAEQHAQATGEAKRAWAKILAEIEKHEPPQGEDAR